MRNGFWICVALSMLLAAGPQRCAFAAVVGYWEFGEKSVGSTANVNDLILDSSGNGRDGIVLGTTMSYVTGSPTTGDGIAISKGNNTSRIELAPGPEYAFNDSFTLEAMIRTTQGGVAIAGSIMAIKEGSNEWWLRTNNGKLQALVADGVTFPNFFGNTTINDNQWHHVAMVYDNAADTLTTYVDYAFDNGVTANVAGTIGGATATPIIGRFATGMNPYVGSLEFVRLSTGALTPAEFIQPSVDADFNGDGIVDAADYVVWRKGLGSTHTPEQYDLWRSNFGSPGAAAATAASVVPEPSSLVVAVAGAFFVFVAAKLRTRQSLFK